MTTIGEEAAQAMPEDAGAKPQNAFDDVESATTASGGSIGEDPSGISSGMTRARKPDSVEISPEDKSAFVDAMLSGDRYRRTVSLFGGRVYAVIRSRTTPETQAMYAYMRHELSNSVLGPETLERNMSYILLVAQIDELNGTKFPEMEAPLMFTAKDGGEEAPGWIKQIDAWKAKPESLTSALIDQIQKFEYKYWTMVKEANNKNFWNPGTSS